MRLALLIVGGALVVDTVLVALTGSNNLGTVLPAILGLTPLAVGIFWRPALAFFATPVGRAARAGILAGYALFAVCVGIVAARIALHAAKPPSPGADAVVVLGAAVRGDVPSATLAARLDAALGYLADNPQTCVVVTGGRGPGESVTEASAMRQYLQQRGVAPERIVEEDQSASTQENLANAKALLEQRFPEGARTVIVSSDYHLYRAQRIARGLELEAETLGSPSVPWLLPNFYLREALAVMAYRALGRLG